MRPIESRDRKGRVRGLSKAQGKRVRAGKENPDDFRKTLDEAVEDADAEPRNWAQEDKLDLASEDQQQAPVPAPQPDVTRKPTVRPKDEGNEEQRDGHRGIDLKA